MGKNLIISFVISLVCLAVAFSVLRDDQGETSVDNKRFLPSFSDELQNINKIEISSKDGTFLTLNKKNNFWKIEQLQDFLADRDNVNAVLFAFATADIKDTTTKNKDKYHSLGVRDISDPESEAMQYSFFQDETQKYQVLVGKETFTGREAYIYAREASKEQSYLLQSHMRKYTQAEHIKDTHFDAINKDDIAKVTFLKDNKSFDINATGDYVSEGAELDKEKVKEFLKKFTSLPASDILAKTKEGIKITDALQLTTKDNKTITIEQAVLDDVKYLSVQGSADLASQELFAHFYIRNTQLTELLETKFSSLVKK